MTSVITARAAEHCLICYDNISNDKQDDFNLLSPSPVSLIEKQVSVVFVLRNLLKIPMELMQHYFQISEGDNPECWIGICEKCRGDVEEARRIFEEIVKTNRRFRVLQSKVVRKMKDSFKILSYNGVDGAIKSKDSQTTRKIRRKAFRREDIPEVVTKQSRNFVNNHNYGATSNPFITGDMEAKRLMEVLRGVRVPGSVSPSKSEVKVNPQIPSQLGEKIEGANVPMREKSDIDNLDRFCDTVDVDNEDMKSSTSKRISLYQTSKDIKQEADDLQPLSSPPCEYQLIKDDYAIPSSPSFDMDQEDEAESDQDSDWEEPQSKSEDKPNSSENNYIDDGNHSGGGGDDNPMAEKKRRPADRPKRPYKTPTRKYNLIDVEGAFYGHDGKVNFRCPVEYCDKILRSKRTFDLHKLRHSVKKEERLNFRCRECGKRYASDTGLALHKKTVHRKHVRTEAEKDKAREANRKWTARNIFRCHHCDWTTRFKKSLEAHIVRKHETTNKICCEICGKGEVSNYELKRHHADIHFICSVEECRLTLGGRAELRDHQVETHGKEVDVFKCEECGKLLVTAKWFRKHMLIHEHRRTLEEAGVKTGVGAAGQFICDLCGNQFPVKEYLNRHKREVHDRKVRKKKCGK